MKKIIFVSIIVSYFFTSKTQAQHCPFDGTSIVILKVKNGQNKTDFKLVEINNPKADSCSYGKGLLVLPFQPIDSFYSDNDWVQAYEERYKMAQLSSKGQFYVSFSMAMVDCMLARDNDFEYLKRQFILTFKDLKTGKLGQIKVSKKSIYSLCISYGSWDRIKPILIH